MPTNLRPDQLVTLLRRAIRERMLVPGQSLNQDELARRFGVSRIPLREALRTLTGEGLVVMRPGIGAVVTELHAQELTELFDLRMQIEPALTAATVGRVSATELAELRLLAARIDQLAASGSDVDAWSTQHYAFHRRLFELAGRRHALRLVMQVVNLMEPYARLSMSLDQGQDHAHQEHSTLLDAIEAGDPDLVADVVTKTIGMSRQRLSIAVESDAAAADPLAALLVDLQDER
ncbi:GntR family transcriptional regulator [Dermatophilaceae bacterium Sec6.4]